MPRSDSFVVSEDISCPFIGSPRFSLTLAIIPASLKWAVASTMAWAAFPGFWLLKMFNRLDYIAAAGFSFCPYHSDALIDSTQRLTQIPGAADKWNCKW